MVLNLELLEWQSSTQTPNHYKSKATKHLLNNRGRGDYIRGGAYIREEKHSNLRSVKHITFPSFFQCKAWFLAYFTRFRF